MCACVGFARAFFAAVQRASDHDGLGALLSDNEKDGDGDTRTTRGGGSGSKADDGDGDDVCTHILFSAAVMLCRVYDTLMQQPPLCTATRHAANMPVCDGDDAYDEEAALRALPVASRRAVVAQLWRMPLSDVKSAVASHGNGDSGCGGGDNAAANYDDAAHASVTTELARVATRLHTQPPLSSQRPQQEHKRDATCDTMAASLAALFASLTPATRTALLLAALWTCTKVWASALQRVSLHRVLYDVMQQATVASATHAHTATSMAHAATPTTSDECSGAHDDAQGSAGTRVANNNNNDAKDDVAQTTADMATRANADHASAPVLWVSSPLLLDTQYTASAQHLQQHHEHADGVTVHAGGACRAGRTDADEGRDDAPAVWPLAECGDDDTNDEDTATALIDAIEDAEMVLLRCSNYAVPLLRH